MSVQSEGATSGGESSRWALAGSLAAVEAGSPVVTHVKGQTVALFKVDGRVYAVDNRCPHMGFPLHRGSVRDCVLTCHWHHARFDLAGGGTFDPWADDLRVFPVEIREGEIWIDLSPRADPMEHQSARLRDGLERSISLVVGKAVIALMEGGRSPVDPFRVGLDYGVRCRRNGWSQGLTMHTCFLNLLPHLDPVDRPHALFHGLSAVGQDTSGMAPRIQMTPLPGSDGDLETLKRWFRQFIEVRDGDGAERCVVSAVQAGATSEQMADMLFAAATDHRYISTGHPVDFTNKALEALDSAGWEYAEPVLASLVPSYTGASRTEESSSWRYPIDLIAILDRAFEAMPAALETGRSQQRAEWDGRERLAPVLLGEDPQAITDALLSELQEGARPAEVAAAVTYAASLRIAHFHINNDFNDWDTALHTFTFSNAVEQGLRRSPSPELVRGVFDAAMSVYLDRFLNVPPTPLPSPEPDGRSSQAILAQFPELLDQRQQVNQAGQLVARFLAAGGDTRHLIAIMGKLLLREDRNFHTIQAVEAAVRQYGSLEGKPAGAHVLVAAARYLAAHAATSRQQDQVFQIAQRLNHGDALFEER